MCKKNILDPLLDPVPAALPKHLQSFFVATLIQGFDVQAGTFISREAYISIDSNDDVIALHSYSNFQSDISVCHVVKVSQFKFVIYRDDFKKYLHCL